MIRALPILLLFLFNFFVILLGAPFMYALNITLYRLLEPTIGRFLTTLIQAAISANLVFLWLYVWRLVYYLMFKKNVEKFSNIEISQ